MAVRVTVKTDKNKWKKAVNGAAFYATKVLAEQMLADSRDYIPDDGEHALRDAWAVRVKGKKVYLVASMVYALYQWFGVRADGSHKVKNYTTPGTGTQWVEKARAARQDAWDRVVQNAFTEGMNGTK